MRIRFSDKYKEAMKGLLKKITGALLAGCSAIFIASAATPAGSASDASATDAEELTMEQNLAIPAVPSKLSTFVKSYMKREALALHKMGYKVETMRKGEVVIVTVPTDRLFAPNDTALLPTAANDLKNFLPYFRVPGKFKVILALHTDDTGSENYLNSLSEKRIVSLYDYFDSNAADTDNLIGYPLASIEPLKENTSRAGRAENRRLEIFIVPGDVLIEEAKPAK